jgi:DNA-binding MarR family transcriptional regulator
MQPNAGRVAPDSLERIEQALTHLVHRLQRVRLHVEGPVQLLERSAYTILGLLNDAGPMRNGALAARLQLDASTVSRHVAALQQAGLTTREVDPDDGRACRLRLTSAGQRAVGETRQVRRAAVRELVGSWPSDEQDTFAALLERLNVGLDDLVNDAAAGGPPLVGGNPDGTAGVPEKNHAEGAMRV